MFAYKHVLTRVLGKVGHVFYKMALFWFVVCFFTENIYILSMLLLLCIGIM